MKGIKGEERNTEIPSLQWQTHTHTHACANIHTQTLPFGQTLQKCDRYLEILFLVCGSQYSNIYIKLSSLSFFA